MARWKVDEWVRVKGTRVRLHIIEVVEQTCYAGTQIHYKGRVFFKEGFAKIWSPSKDNMQSFLEIELEPIPEVRMSKQLDALVVEYRKAKARKEKLCKAQDFEKASEERNTQRKLLLQIEDICEKEGIEAGDISL